MRALRGRLRLVGSKDGTLLYVFYGSPCDKGNGLTRDKMIHFVAAMCCCERGLFRIFFHVFIFSPFLSVVCMFLPFVFRRSRVENFCLLECKRGIAW